MKMRELSVPFMNDLKDSDGRLHPLLERLRIDHTLLLSIRENYINVYYRGGSILKVETCGKGYSPHFNQSYAKNSVLPIPDLPKTILNREATQKWVDAFPVLKQTMDFFFAKHQKPEREFQQLVVRENNNSTISTHSDYFITDIECAGTVPGARFDMVAIRWRSLGPDRKDGRKCRAALIEMKYGDTALAGKAGLLKHLKDFDTLILDNDKYVSLLRGAELQFRQLDELGAFTFTHNNQVKLSEKEKPEVIFMLANHTPKKKKLMMEINDPAIDTYLKAANFDLKFSISNFAGYGLYANCMFTLPEFRTLLKSQIEQ